MWALGQGWLNTDSVLPNSVSLIPGHFWVGVTGSLLSSDKRETLTTVVQTPISDVIVIKLKIDPFMGSSPRTPFLFDQTLIVTRSSKMT